MLDLFAMIREMAPLPCAPGEERALLSFLSEQAAPYVDDSRFDTLGNLILHKKGPGPRVLLCARADTPGLAVTHIDNDGFIHVGALGTLSPAALNGRAVTFSGGVRGVCVLSCPEKEQTPAAEHLFIDIGATGRADAEARVKVGSSAAFIGEALRLDARLAAPGLGARLGCAILLRALSILSQPACDLYMALCVQDSLGHRGMQTAVHGVAPDAALVIAPTLCRDNPDSPSPDASSGCRLGHGPALRLMDASFIPHGWMLKRIADAADAEKIPLQRVVCPSESSGGGALYASCGGRPAGNVGFPIRYGQTGYQTADLGDADGCVRLLMALIQEKWDAPA